MKPQNHHRIRSTPNPTDLVERALGLPRPVKRAVALAVDVLLVAASVQVAFFLRLGEWQLASTGSLYATLAAIVLAIPLFVTSGLYRAVFRFSGQSAQLAIARACALFALPYMLVFMFIGITGIPRTVGLIEPPLLFLCISGSRALAHWWLGSTYRNRYIDRNNPRAVIYGAGGAGRQLASALRQSQEIRLIGFVDDDRSMVGSTLNGVPIYSPDDLELLAREKLVDEVLLAIPSLSMTKRRTIVQQLSDRGIHVRMLPAMVDIARGKVTLSDLREVAIEDLLSRPPVPPDETLLSASIEGRCVLVTGAGGSIGSELSRQIFAIGPSRLVLLDSSEFNLYSIHAELEDLRTASGGPEVIALLGSVRDRNPLSELFSRFQPTTVYHAAAYKHVPLVEENPLEGLANNVFGTALLVELAAQAEVDFFILISSDKAVRPTNVMGATKRLAELIVQAYAAESLERRYSMVRFGNVLGSSGSVVPRFRQQILDGGPVTVTDPAMTRYFMTIPEAAQLVVQAGAMARGGEVFVLDMGEPVLIIEMARNMIKLSGLAIRDETNPDGDIEIKITGRRPGEKLYEELLIGNNPMTSSHPRIMQADESMIAWPELKVRLDGLERTIESGDVNKSIRLLAGLIGEYTPSDRFSAIALPDDSPAIALTG